MISIATLWPPASADPDFSHAVVAVPGDGGGSGGFVKTLWKVRPDSDTGIALGALSILRGRQRCWGVPFPRGEPPLGWTVRSPEPAIGYPDHNLYC